MDSTKSALADVRHRAVLHSAFGVFIVEKVFGTTIDVGGKKVSVRDIAEDHVREDLGFIPSMETWLRGMKIEDWMMGKRKVGETKFIPMEEEDVTIDTAAPKIDPQVFVSGANTDGIKPVFNIANFKKHSTYD